MKKILLTSLGFLLFISCGLDDGPPIEEVPAELRISSFDLNKIEVTAGDDVKASWKIQGADKISLVIEPDGELKQELPITDPLSELTRPVLKDTVFRLVATQGPRKIEKIQSVAVLPAEASQGGDPSILIDFNASEKCLRSGQTTKLSWQVQNADSLEFDPVSLMIAPNAFRGEKVVPLQVNTTFKLTARKGANASAFKSVVVRVDPIRYTTTLTEKIVRDHSDVAIDPQDPEHFYLATTTNLYEWLRGVLTNLDVVPRDEFKAVAINQTDPDLVYAAHHEMVRRSPDGGQTWPSVIPVIDLGRPQNIASIAARDHDLIIAGNSGIFHHDSTSRENPTIDLVSQIAGL
ncbi:MAG: hypothetical protein Q7S98_01610, partial [Deltaproteobacteria bacterium]|nr:hypothetical protein [Deltaproteobacteria bacterium]